MGRGVGTGGGEQGGQGTVSLGRPSYFSDAGAEAAVAGPVNAHAL